MDAFDEVQFPGMVNFPTSSGDAYASGAKSAMDFLVDADKCLHSHRQPILQPVGTKGSLHLSLEGLYCLAGLEPQPHAHPFVSPPLAFHHLLSLTSIPPCDTFLFSSISSFPPNCIQPAIHTLPNIAFRAHATPYHV
ncbi:unnamed protein product [Peniophora sp. CBMAI 1063]|nr:unnamed protein product [Peniophora sp. CBMAI 1063]